MSSNQNERFEPNYRLNSYEAWVLYCYHRDQPRASDPAVQEKMAELFKISNK